MKTDDLINLLSQDTKGPARLDHMLSTALAAGIAVSVTIFFLKVGLRPNIEAVLETTRVFFKIATTFVLAVTACTLLFKIGRPGIRLSVYWGALLIPLFAVVVAVLIELYVLPEAAWRASMVGRYARFCLIYIPILSLAPLFAFLWALRFSAPEKPTVAGGVAGLAASSIAAALYAWHCPDDSPLFVATWYVLAMALITLSGAVIGSRVLRW